MDFRLRNTSVRQLYACNLNIEAQKIGFRNAMQGTSLVVQWLRIRLPMQGTWVQALVWENPTCRGATELVHHNY